MKLGRNHLTKIVIGAAATLFSVALVEATFRSLHPEETRWANLERLARESNSWARPDAEFHHVGDGDFALRFPAASNSQKSRVMLVGDSFTWGHGVGAEYRFGTLLQKEFGEKIKIDILATPSYSPIIYRNIVRRALSLTHYAAVFVFVDQTDPVNDLIYELDLSRQRTSSSHFDLDLMLERENLAGQTYRLMIDKFQGLEGLVRRSTIYNSLFPVSLLSVFPKTSRHYQSVQLMLKDSPKLAKEFELEPTSASTQKMETLLFRYLDEIAMMCQAKNIPLLLTGNPWEYQVSREPRTVQVVPGPYPRENRLELILHKRYGMSPMISVVPLTESFRKYSVPSNLFLDSPPNEIHWNREGHALVEKILRERLQQEKGLLTR